MEQRTYHPDRLAHVAIHRAPRVAIVNVGDVVNALVPVTLACGHTKNCVTHFHYTVGNKMECYECGKAIALTLPEFADAKEQG